MAKAKGIHARRFYALGKAPAKKDKRNFKLAALLKVLPPVPASWDYDLAHPKFQIPLPMFGNDEFGDCVIAGRAHQTLRFETVEQNTVIALKDSDVLREYWKEEGGKGPAFDNGLVVLDSLNLWRKQGWRAAGRKYTIYAFAQVNQKNHTEVEAAIFLLTGAGAGLSLPKSAQAQITAGQVWDVTTGPGAAPGSWGGHYVYLTGYTPQGPVCVTWGQKQAMTWAFLDKYCDELYGIVDDRDKFLKRSPLDVKLLDSYLHQL